MAEWLRRGLQILARRFDSGSGLQTDRHEPGARALDAAPVLAELEQAAEFRQGHVLNVLGMLVELEPKQADLLNRICDGALISMPPALTDVENHN